MKNDLNIKASLFAQYILAEPICQSSNSEGILSVDTYSDTIKYGFEKRYLLLKHISFISEEDINHCIDYLELSENESAYFRNGNFFYTSFVSCCEVKEVYHHMPGYIKEYLRSKGYALPFMGYSIEKQIGYGWIKLCK